MVSKVLGSGFAMAESRSRMEWESDLPRVCLASNSYIHSMEVVGSLGSFVLVPISWQMEWHSDTCSRTSSSTAACSNKRCPEPHCPEVSGHPKPCPDRQMSPWPDGVERLPPLTDTSSSSPTPPGPPPGTGRAGGQRSGFRG